MIKKINKNKATKMVRICILLTKYFRLDYIHFCIKNKDFTIYILTMISAEMSEKERGNE